MSKTRPRLLLVEDDSALATLISDELEAEGWQVLWRDNISDGLGHLSGECPSLVITDLRLPDGSGMDVVRRVVSGFQEDIRPGLIVITAFGSVQQAVEALKAGADDFLTKPLDLDHFLISVRKVMETRQLKEEVRRFRSLREDRGFHGLYGNSPPMRKLYEQIAVVARANGPVLINGESGTGKELVAKAIHLESERAKAPFLIVNCAGIPQELLESEFFGHAPGAFTGAAKARKGLLQEADGGTLLLDEIGEMPLALQAKLLRALQDGSIRPVGQDHEEKVDVRILAATHRNLKQKVDAGEFREDLYYRLETFTLQVPPLREREGDVELLALRLMRQLAVAQGKDIKGFSAKALQLINQYPFPGNVRELHNVVERAVTFCNESQVKPEHFPERMLNKIAGQQHHAIETSNAIDSSLLAGDVMPSMEELQKRYVKMIMDKTGGNKRRAAALLGIGRRTLYRWLEEEEKDFAPE